MRNREGMTTEAFNALQAGKAKWVANGVKVNVVDKHDYITVTYKWADGGRINVTMARSGEKVSGASLFDAGRAAVHGFMDRFTRAVTKSGKTPGEIRDYLAAQRPADVAALFALDFNL